LMGVLRGSGPGGLGGVSRRRGIGGNGRMGEVRVVRPCLDLPRSELLRLCREAGFQWREDLTNADTTKLRSALRHEVIPQLKRLRPGVEARAAHAAHLLKDAAGLIEDVAREARDRAVIEASAGFMRLARPVLREQREVVVGAILRQGAIDVRGERGQDQFGRTALEPVIRAIRDDRTEARRFAWADLGIVVRAREVELRRLK
jgi:tRNA(Ile)-lysidine synthase TilS/MesJ